MTELDDPSVLELPDEDHPVYTPDWRIFAPTLIILALYSAGLLLLWSKGMNHSALFRLFVIVTAVGVPLLAAHAFLRHQTARVQLLPDRIRYHPGWPKDIPLDIPRELVTRLHIKRGIFGTLFGGGTLVIETNAGTRMAIADLADPEAILSAYSA